MSYNIEYQPHKKHRYPFTVRKFHTSTMIMILCCMVIFYAVSSLKVSTYIDKWFLLLDGLASDVRENTQVGQAVTAYFQDLLYNG